MTGPTESGKGNPKSDRGDAYVLQPDHIEELSKKTYNHAVVILLLVFFKVCSIRVLEYLVSITEMKCRCASRMVRAF